MGANNSWTTGFLLSLLSTAAMGQVRPNLKLSIVVYHSAQVGTQTLERAERVAGTVLLTAAIQSTWVPGAVEDIGNLGMDFTAYTAKDCQAAPVSAVMRLQILPRASVGLPSHALALSLPCARSGVQVTIFADRVANVSETGGPTFRRVLGYAIAHELGHVLLQSDAHATAGLMKGVWGESDWQRASVSIISFSPADARQITTLHKRTPDENAAQTASLNAH
jgi:hypothetical protein